jgi:predicted Zn-dependent peptidase
MFQKITLKNGLRLILWPRKETQAVTVMFGVGVGSRDEPDEIAGISHFIEHMNFKGTKKRPTATDVAEFIDDIGGMSNAYTSKEHTAYYVKISSDHILEAFDYLADNIQNSTNLLEEFDRERGVVMEDLKMHKDRPMEEVAELFEEAIFTDKSFGSRIIGYPKTVQQITRDNLVDFKNKTYFAENSVLAVVGNFGKLSEKEVIKKIEEYFTLNHGNKITREASGVISNKTVTVGEMKTEQSNLVIGFAAPSLKDENRYAARMLAQILGGSMSSRMFTEIREKKGLAYAIETSYQGYSDTGLIVTQAGVAHQNIEETIKAIMQEYKKIISEKVNLSELKRVKEIIKGGILIGIEDSENLADMLICMELIQGKLETPEEAIKKYQAITEEDILRVAKKYINFNTVVISVVGPNINQNKINKLLK